MKLSVTSLIILALLSINVGAQESSSRGLLAGARMRIGKGRIFEIKYSQDGTRLAVASSIGIWLYDTSSHQEMDLLAVHPTGVRSVAFSSDGRMLASGSSDGAVRLWDAKTGKQLQSLSGHARIVTSVAFSPDGRTLASGNSDGTVLLWDLGSDPTSNSTVSIVPSVVTSPMPGERLTVAVNIAARESVAGCRVTVMFDHAALRYVKAAAGDYVTEGALFKQPKIRGNGVWLEASKLDCDGESDGTLAVLTFEVRAVKTSTLHLSRVNLVDPHGERLFPRLEDAQVVEPRK